MIEQHLDCTNIGTWVHDSQEGQLFRFNTYKKVYTPYEQDKKYMDESEFENGGYVNIAKITNVIEVPNDLLIEFDEYIEEEQGEFKRVGRKLYRLLSEIRLEKLDCDNGEEDY